MSLPDRAFDAIYNSASSNIKLFLSWLLIIFFIVAGIFNFFKEFLIDYLKSEMIPKIIDESNMLFEEKILVRDEKLNPMPNKRLIILKKEYLSDINGYILIDKNTKYSESVETLDKNLVVLNVSRNFITLSYKLNPTHIEIQNPQNNSIISPNHQLAMNIIWKSGDKIISDKDQPNSKLQINLWNNNTRIYDFEIKNLINTNNAEIHYENAFIIKLAKNIYGKLIVKPEIILSSGIKLTTDNKESNEEFKVYKQNKFYPLDLLNNSDVPEKNKFIKVKDNELIYSVQKHRLITTKVIENSPFFEKHNFSCKFAIMDKSAFFIINISGVQFIFKGDSKYVDVNVNNTIYGNKNITFRIELSKEIKLKSYYYINIISEIKDDIFKFSIDGDSGFLDSTDYKKILISNCASDLKTQIYYYCGSGKKDILDAVFVKDVIGF